MRTLILPAVVASLLVFAVPVMAASLSINFISSSGVEPGATLSFIAVASGFTNPSFSVSDTYPGSTISNSDINSEGYFTWTPTENDAGSHLVTVSAEDAAGNSASSTVTLGVISNAVFIKSVSPGAVIGISHAVTFSVSAPGFINPAYIVSDSYLGTSVSGADINSSGAFSWTPAVNQQGVHTVTVYAYDAYGHSGNATQTITVTNPQLSLGSWRGSGAVGNLFTFQLSASGFSGSPSFSVSDLFSTSTTLSGADVSGTGAASWVPNASDIGPHLFTFTATDVSGNAASTTASMTVTAASAVSPTAVATPAPASVPPASSSVAATPNVSAPGARYIFSKLLAQGASGAGVTALQERLTALNFYNGPVTGYFGALTVAGVVRFQKAHGLSQVGYLGPLTRAALNVSS